MKAAPAALALLLLAPLGASAQWAVTAQAGVHMDRVSRPERVLTSASTRISSAPGEATALGLRATFWAGEHFGLDGGITLSQNHSFSGSYVPPRPSLVTRTVFTSLAAMWRSADPTAPWRFHAGRVLPRFRGQLS